MSPALRRTALWGAKLAVSAGLLWLAFRIAGEADLAALRLAAPGWLAAAAAIVVVIVAILALRWRLVAEGLGAAPPAARPHDWAGLIWAGIAVSQVVPGGISGDAVRVFGMVRLGAPLGRTVEAVALDRAMGLAGLLLLGGLAWAALGGAGPLALVAAAGLAGAGALWLALRLLAARGWLAGPRARLAAWRGVALSRRGAGVLALAMAGHALNVLIFACVAQAFGLDPGLAACFLAVPAGLLAAAVPVSLGGWGVREIAIANGFALAGGDPAAGAQASILFGLFHLAANAPGLVLALRWVIAGRLRTPFQPDGGAAIVPPVRGEEGRQR